MSDITGTYLFNVRCESCADALMLIATLLYSARPQVWTQPQDYTTSRFTEPQSRRSARERIPFAVRERTGKEIKDATRTPELPIPEVYITLIPALCFQFPEYVRLHSGLSRCSLDPTAWEHKRKSGPGESGGHTHTLHSAISNLFIYNLQSACAPACCEQAEPRNKFFRIISVYSLGICTNGLSQLSDSLNYETTALLIGIQAEAHQCSCVTFDKRYEGITT